MKEFGPRAGRPWRSRGSATGYYKVMCGLPKTTMNNYVINRLKDSVTFRKVGMNNKILPY